MRSSDFQQTISSGSYAEQLAAVRDQLAGGLLEARGDYVPAMAGLARQLVDVLDRLQALPAAVPLPGGPDEVQARRAAREAARQAG